MTRTLLVREFGIENRNGHLNCFLNVGLQTLWQFQFVRQHLRQMCAEKIKSSKKIAPLVQAIKDFYQQAFEREEDTKIPELSSNNMRKELFKLFYNIDEFQINSKADAFEALDKLLGVLHGWETESTEEEYFESVKAICGQSCFVHQGFF